MLVYEVDSRQHSIISFLNFLCSALHLCVYLLVYWKRRELRANQTTAQVGSSLPSPVCQPLECTFFETATPFVTSALIAY